MSIGRWWITIRFAWYDMWIGAFWDRQKRILYVCPFPMVLVTIKRWPVVFGGGRP